MCVFLDDPTAETTADFYDYNEELQAQSDLLSLLLPWMAEHERSFSELAKDPRFPGAHADADELRMYAQYRARNASRIVDCQVNLGAFRVRAQVDLVGGQVFVLDNGRYVPLDQNTMANVEFPQAPGALMAFAHLVDGRIKQMYPVEVLRVVEALMQANALPAICPRQG